eukprot:1409019-Ditylum_brightwellii.AAC.1
MEHNSVTTMEGLSKLCEKYVNLFYETPVHPNQKLATWIDGIKTGITPTCNADRDLWNTNDFVANDCLHCRI